jgi:hypothetical protein
MKATAHRRALLLTMLVALVSAPPPAAAVYARQAQQAQLPAFAVKTLDGTEAQSDQLSTRRQWLLIYVQPNCKPCEEVFNVFRREGEAQPDLTQKVVVVVGGATVEEASELAEHVPWLPRSAWYADPSRQAASALSVKGAPTVYGVRQGKVEWELKGAKANPRMLKSILETWSEG